MTFLVSFYAHQASQKAPKVFLLRMEDTHIDTSGIINWLVQNNLKESPQQRVCGRRFSAIFSEKTERGTPTTLFLP
jgi:hypothetical protein